MNSSTSEHFSRRLHTNFNIRPKRKIQETHSELLRLCHVLLRVVGGFPLLESVDERLRFVLLRVLLVDQTGDHGSRVEKVTLLGHLLQSE